MQTHLVSAHPAERQQQQGSQDVVSQYPLLFQVVDVLKACQECLNAFAPATKAKVGDDLALLPLRIDKQGQLATVCSALNR